MISRVSSQDGAVLHDWRELFIFEFIALFFLFHLRIHRHPCKAHCDFDNCFAPTHVLFFAL